MGLINCLKAERSLSLRAWFLNSIPKKCQVSIHPSLLPMRWNATLPCGTCVIVKHLIINLFSNAYGYYFIFCHNLKWVASLLYRLLFPDGGVDYRVVIIWDGGFFLLDLCISINNLFVINGDSSGKGEGFKFVHIILMSLRSNWNGGDKGVRSFLVSWLYLKLVLDI